MQKTFDIIIEGEVVAKLVLVKTSMDTMQVHNYVYKWNKSIYLAFLLKFEEVKAQLKEEGITRLVASSNQLDNSKLVKYWRMMGFFDPEVREALDTKILYCEMEV